LSLAAVSKVGQMLELDIGKLSPDIATIFMLRGAESPSIQWQAHANRGAKRLLDTTDDRKLFGAQGVADEAMAAAVRALLYLWHGWIGECSMYSQAAPEQERLYINALCERMNGNSKAAKELFQKLGENPFCEPLTKSALELIGSSSEAELQRYRQILEMGHVWEPFAFCDLYLQARAGQLCAAGEQTVAHIQAREFELLFCHCYEAATRVNAAKRQGQAASVKPQRKPERRRRASTGLRSHPSVQTGRTPDQKAEQNKPPPAGQGPKTPESVIKVICPACQTRVTFSASARGQQFKCPKCAGLFLIPRKDEAAPGSGSARPPALDGLKVLCPQCRQVLAFPESARGQKQTCNRCQAVFVVPQKRPIAVASA
jgi:Zn-finger nucleic acid-binding protein